MQIYFWLVPDKSGWFMIVALQTLQPNGYHLLSCAALVPMGLIPRVNNYITRRTLLPGVHTALSNMLIFTHGTVCGVVDLGGKWISTGSRGPAPVNTGAVDTSIYPSTHIHLKITKPWRESCAQLHLDGITVFEYIKCFVRWIDVNELLHWSAAMK